MYIITGTVCYFAADRDPKLHRKGAIGCEIEKNLRPFVDVCADDRTADPGGAGGTGTVAVTVLRNGEGRPVGGPDGVR